MSKRNDKANVGANVAKGAKAGTSWFWMKLKPNGNSCKVIIVTEIILSFPF
jgi:hypothetical protein